MPSSMLGRSSGVIIARRLSLDSGNADYILQWRRPTGFVDFLAQLVIDMWRCGTCAVSVTTLQFSVISAIAQGQKFFGFEANFSLKVNGGQTCGASGGYAKLGFVRGLFVLSPFFFISCLGVVLTLRASVSAAEWFLYKFFLHAMGIEIPEIEVERHSLLPF
nr:hypothetical protein Iba_chr05fCG12390 [Ipomoea batatas]